MLGKGQSKVWRITWSLQFISLLCVVVWLRNSPIGLRYLNIYFPAGNAVWGGFGAAVLMDEVCHQGVGPKNKRPPWFPGFSICYMSAVQDACSLLQPWCLPPAVTLCNDNDRGIDSYSFGTIGPNQPFSLQVDLVMLLDHSNRSITNIPCMGGGERNQWWWHQGDRGGQGEGQEKHGWKEQWGLRVWRIIAIKRNKWIRKK